MYLTLPAAAAALMKVTRGYNFSIEINFSEYWNQQEVQKLLELQ